MPKRRHTTYGLTPSPSFVLVTAVILILVTVSLVGIADSNVFVAILPFALVALLLYLRSRLRRRRRIRRLAQLRRLGDLLALTPAQFEAATADLLRQLGYRSIQRKGRPGDLAADISCLDQQGNKVVVQCKRYAPGAKVGSPDIQKFIGMVAIHHEADRGIFITTSQFTAPAEELAKRHSVTRIDGVRLTALVEQVTAKTASSLPTNAP